MSKRATFEVSIDRHYTIGHAELREYIRKAITCERGQYLPEDPLWHLDVDSLTIKDVKDD